MSELIRSPYEPDARPAWTDLRSWLAAIQSESSLLRITAEVDPNEEVAAITYMATRRRGSPAFLFERFPRNPLNARVLTNMLGASKERFAIAVGLDPQSSRREMVEAAREIIKRRTEPTWISSTDAPVNENVLLDGDFDLRDLPVPKFWPADGGPFIGTGGITLTTSPSGRV